MKISSQLNRNGAANLVAVKRIYPGTHLLLGYGASYWGGRVPGEEDVMMPGGEGGEVEGYDEYDEYDENDENGDGMNEKKRELEQAMLQAWKDEHPGEDPEDPNAPPHLIPEVDWPILFTHITHHSNDS